MTTHPTEWNAELYDRKHGFVSELAVDLVELLDPQAGETILDLGCGTGHLAATIAQRGAMVMGIDSSAAMIQQAREHYPSLQFEVADATQLTFSSQFNAVFSNAVLHWIPQPELVIAGIWQALKPGGRFVAEFGGKGNVRAIVTALSQILHTEEPTKFWYFPSVGEYATLVEAQGFEVTLATLFDRPTPLDGEQGMQNWIHMFANQLLQAIPGEQQPDFWAEVDRYLRPQLYQAGGWYADYRRIRIVAVKPMGDGYSSRA